jgi:hypothetical protein
MSDREGHGIYLRREEHLREWDRLERAVADSKGVETEDLAKTETLMAAAEAFLQREQFRQARRLLKDQRIREARQAVARDHNMEPEEVSLEALLKITSGAYCGYQQTSDWRPESDNRAGYKTAAKANGDTH